MELQKLFAECSDYDLMRKLVITNELTGQKKPRSEIDEYIKNKPSLSKDEKDLHKPLVILGPSGAGKGTLIKKLTDKYNEKFGFSVSYTTRKPREGETQGVSYYFITTDVFEKKIKNNDFIEYCKVHDNMYGTEKH